MISKFDIVSSCYLDISRSLSYRLVKLNLSKMEPWIPDLLQVCSSFSLFISVRTTTVYPVVWEKHRKSSLIHPFYVSHLICHKSIAFTFCISRKLLLIFLATSSVAWHSLLRGLLPNFPIPSAPNLAAFHPFFSQKCLFLKVKSHFSSRWTSDSSRGPTRLFGLPFQPHIVS